MWLIEVCKMGLRHGFRSLVNAPGFTLLVTLILAIGIGASTAVFSLVDANLLHPLPYKDSKEIVGIWATYDRLPKGEAIYLSFPEFLSIRGQSRVFRQVAAFQSKTAIFTGRGEPEDIRGAAVSPELFSLLGVKATLGTTLRPGDDAPGSNPVVVLSYAFWKRHFSADDVVTGQPAIIDGKPYAIIGVLQQNFAFPDKTDDFWIPFGVSLPDSDQRREHGIRVIARLQRGVSVGEAQAALSIISSELAKSFPATDKGWGIRAGGYLPLPSYDIQRSLLVLSGAVGFVLLLAYANVAILLLARGAARRKEIAIHRALGASQIGITSRFMLENLFLAGFGGCGGLCLATICIWLLQSPTSKYVEALRTGHLNLHALAVAFVISLLGAILFGGIASLQLSGADLESALRSSGSQFVAGSRFWQRVRSSLVVVQVSVALILLVGSGLLIRSFLLLSAVEPGFDADNILAMDISLQRLKYSTSNMRLEFANNALNGPCHLPSVTGCAIVSELPLREHNSIPITPTDQRGQSVPSVVVRFVSPGFFSVLHIPFLRGRDFALSDNITRPCVVIVNATLASVGWGNADPLGSTIDSVFRMPTPTCSIVGTVADSRDVGLAQPPGPEVYFPYDQAPGLDFSVLLRTANNPLRVADAAREQIWRFDNAQPIRSTMAMNSVVASSLDAPRYRTALLSLLSAVAMLLALIGIYSVFSYFVAMQSREIGIRLAMGALPQSVLRMVLRQSLRLVFVGVTIGLIGSAALTHFLARFLFGIGRLDIITYCVAISLIVSAALLASGKPACRAASVDPAIVLKYE